MPLPARETIEVLVQSTTKETSQNNKSPYMKKLK